MNRRNHVRRPPMFERYTALLGNPEGASKDRLTSGSSQTHNHPGRDQFHFGFEPGPAGANLRAEGFLMQASFPSLFELEMLDHIRQINFAPVNGTILKRPIQHSSCRPHERMSLDVLFISRLLADHKHPGFGPPFAEDGLCRMQIKIASLA